MTEAELDPRHPAAFQRGYAESASDGITRRRDLRPREEPTARTEAISVSDTASTTPGAGLASEEETIAPPALGASTDASAEPRLMDLRAFLLLWGLALAMVVAGVGAAWWNATLMYTDYASSIALAQVQSLVQVLAQPLITVGLGAMAAALLMLSYRGRR